MASRMATIGKIIAPFGVNGAVKVYPYSDFLERCYKLYRVKIVGNSICEFRAVIKASIHKGLWILYLEGCDTRNDAEKIRGSLVQIFFSERVPLPDGTYYFDQIIGLEVQTARGEKVGVVKDIIKTGSNDVYVVEKKQQEGNEASGGEIMVPALKKFVQEINTREGYLLLSIPPGLLE